MKTMQMLALKKKKNINPATVRDFRANQNEIWKFFSKSVDPKAPGSPAHMYVTD